MCAQRRLNWLHASLAKMLLDLDSRVHCDGHPYEWVQAADDWVPTSKRGTLVYFGDHKAPPPIQCARPIAWRGQGSNSTERRTKAMGEPNQSGVKDPLIPKRKTSRLAKCKPSTPTERVEKLLTPLPVMKLSDAGDFVRIHPTKISDELFYVMVPQTGSRDGVMHLISEELALLLSRGRKVGGKVKRFKLALGAKPYDAFFLAVVPVVNLDNEWNRSMLEAIELAKKGWREVISRRDENIEGYRAEPPHGQDPYDEPKWPEADIEELVETAFDGRIIDSEDDPAWKRIAGIRQTIS
jgi:hypothetical protein